MMNVHESRLDGYLARGMVVVRPGGTERVWVADPARTCLHRLRGGLCEGDLGHRGRHSTVWYWCDACGRSRRGQPYRVQVDANGEPDVEFCFMCCEVNC